MAEPSKLKFNPDMFNLAALKPGAKNKKLEELKQKRANEPTKALQTTDNQFTRPIIPKKRRTKSKQKLDIEDDIKQQDNDEKSDIIYNQSGINLI